MPASEELQDNWDCVVVGGGAAGLSAALVLGRARRRTLLVDAGNQSNLPAHGIGGLLGNDGTPPGEFYAGAREELAAYPSVEVREGEVVRAARPAESSFELELADGSTETSKRVVLAMGTDYRYADVPGLTERWGRSVFHCPFCHGWEVREKRLGVLDSGATAAKRALLLRTWSDDVTLFANGPAELDPEDEGRLRAAGVEVDERPVAEVSGPGETVEAIRFSDGDERPCDGLMVGVTMHQRSTLAADLGADMDEPAGPAADPVAVGMTRETSVPGLFAAGDMSIGMQSVANAVATGSMAAAGVVHSLMLDG
jgi:thioredoxin reductase